MQIKKDFSKDFRLAKKICKELLAKNKNAIIELYNRYQQMFFLFIGRLIHNKKKENIEDVLNKFWLELLNAKAICSYEGRASLKTYLLKILKQRIIDDNLSFKRSNKNNEKNLKCVLNNEEYIQSQENDLIQKDRLRLLQETILMLELNSPHDADLIRMYMDGLNYRQMAEKKLNDQKKDEDKLIKLTNSIKKQFTRKKGTMANFKKHLNRCLRKHKLDYTDILN
ncbi:sigma-70 family RNA polymerase sigma factor [bacterium]|nr:sigma-70 family RNA polymerase sigma factor [bacterium]